MATEVATGFVSIVPSLKGFTGSLTTQINAAAQAAGASAATVLGKSLSGVGDSLTKKVTLPITAVGIAATAMAVDFEANLAKIEGLVGLTGDEVAGMKDEIIALGTEYGASASDAANAMFFITSAGLRGADAMSVLEASLKASAVGLGDVQTVADLATSAMNAYGPEVLTAGQATDVLTAAVREGKLEADTLSGAIGRTLPIASAMGVRFDEVAAAFAAMSRTGTDANEAATQLRGILTSILQPSVQAEEALAGMGLSSAQLREQLREQGLLATLQTLSDKFAGNEEAAGLVFGNVRALSGVMDLMGANAETTGQIFDSLTDTTGMLDDAFAVTEDTAKFKLSEAFASLKNSLIPLGEAITPIVVALAGGVETVATKFGELNPKVQTGIVAFGAMAAAAGPLLIVAGSLLRAFATVRAAMLTLNIAMGVSRVTMMLLTGYVRGYMLVQTLLSASLYRTVGGWIANTASMVAHRVAWVALQAAAGAQFLVALVSTLAASTSGWIANTASVVANRVATLAASAGMAVMRGAVVAWTAVQWALNAALLANPLVLVVAAIVALIAVVVIAYQRSETFREIVQKAWEGIQKAVSVAVDFIKAYIEFWLKAISAYFRFYWNLVSTIVRFVWEGIVSQIRGAVDRVKTAIAVFSAIVDNVKAWFSDMAAGISGRMEDARASVQRVVDNIRGFFDNARSWLVNAGKNIIQGLIDGIGSMIGSVGSAVGNVVSAINPFGRSSDGDGVTVTGAGRAVDVAGAGVMMSRAVSAPRLRMKLDGQSEVSEVGRIKREPVTNVAVFVDGERARPTRVQVNAWEPNLAGVGA